MTALDPKSDEELMGLYQAGDYSAFELIYSRHSDRVFEYLKKRTSFETAKDLLQEIFLKVHRSRNQYSPQYPFLPWLFAISRNVLFDFFRLNENRVSQASTTDLAYDLAADLKSEVGSSALTLALAKLPEPQRRAIEFRYLGDWSFEKIAKEMEITPLNARQIVSRGVKKLRSKLGGSK